MNQSNPEVSSEPHIITVSPTQYLALDGSGSPDDFLVFAEALREVIRSLKQPLQPLEALWWTDDESEMTQENIANWRWKVMLPLSTPISDDALQDAIDSGQPSKAKDARIFNYNEGSVVQRLFTGSLKNKSAELEAMKEYAASQGCKFTGKYHEIYFNDPGPGARTDAKTILRQPITH